VDKILGLVPTDLESAAHLKHLVEII